MWISPSQTTSCCVNFGRRDVIQTAAPRQACHWNCKLVFQFGYVAISEWLCTSSWISKHWAPGFSDLRCTILFEFAQQLHLSFKQQYAIQQYKLHDRSRRFQSVSFWFKCARYLKKPIPSLPNLKTGRFTVSNMVHKACCLGRPSWPCTFWMFSLSDNLHWNSVKFCTRSGIETFKFTFTALLGGAKWLK
jgi:hypothetical protein